MLLLMFVPLAWLLMLVPCGDCCTDEPLLPMLLVGIPTDSICDCCCWESKDLEDPDGRVPELLEIFELIGDDTFVPRYSGAYAASI